MDDKELVDNLERAWASIAQLCSELQESQWKTGTDCPGWSVQDQVSHLAGTESRLLGRPAPDHVPDGERYGADVRDGHCLGVSVPDHLRTSCNEPHPDTSTAPNVVVS